MQAKNTDTNNMNLIRWHKSEIQQQS